MNSIRMLLFRKQAKERIAGAALATAAGELFPPVLQPHRNGCIPEQTSSTYHVSQSEGDMLWAALCWTSEQLWSVAATVSFKKSPPHHHKEWSAALHQWEETAGFLDPQDQYHDTLVSFKVCLFFLLVNLFFLRDLQTFTSWNLTPLKNVFYPRIKINQTTNFGDNINWGWLDIEGDRLLW